MYHANYGRALDSRLLLDWIMSLHNSWAPWNLWTLLANRSISPTGLGDSGGQEICSGPMKYSSGLGLGDGGGYSLFYWIWTRKIKPWQCWQPSHNQMKPENEANAEESNATRCRQTSSWLQCSHQPHLKLAVP